MEEKKYSYYTKFHIGSESDLDDFWSFVIFRLNVQTDKELYDRFARLYNLLLEQKSILDQKITIFLYETSNYFLIKIKTNIVTIIEKLVSRLKHYNFLYEQEENKLSYEITKVTPKNVNRPLVSKTVEKKKLRVYDFMTKDDLEDLYNLLEKMIDKNYDKVRHALEVDEINDYRTTFSYFSSISNIYPQLKFMSNIVAELSVILSLYLDECLENGLEVRAFFLGFMNNLELWLDTLFKQGCESITFMDASFLADMAQFKILLGLYDEMEETNESSSLDAIFDF